MKLFGKLMIAVLVIAMLLPFTILKDESGDTLMSFSDIELPDFSAPSLPKGPEVDSITDSKRFTGGQDTIYQWHDSEGNIQFTTEPPPEGAEYQVRHFDPDTNVIQSVEVPSREVPVGEVGVDAEKTVESVAEDKNPYSPENLKKIFEDARNVEKLLDQRFQNQESAINQ
jgi:hypothetical protein